MNSEGTVEFKMGERGPKLALGRDRAIRVVLVDLWSPGVKTYLRHARSLDGGASFPMCGPELTVGPDGRMYCAFMSRHRVYWAVSDANVNEFRMHVPTPSPEDEEIYPTAVANRAGFVLLVWQVGPMSTTGKAKVKWACYNGEGRPTGQHETVGTTTSGTKATAFVGSDNDFYVVTTAL